jgi:hypothetical protein
MMRGDDGQAWFLPPFMSKAIHYGILLLLVGGVLIYW